MAFEEAGWVHQGSAVDEDAAEGTPIGEGAVDGTIDGRVEEAASGSRMTAATRARLATTPSQSAPRTSLCSSCPSSGPSTGV